jgi:hypothetical protein
MLGRRGRGLTALAVVLAAVALGACGRDDYENEPRPPVPAEITVEIGEKSVVVSPSTFGAGLVNFTIANLSDTSASLEIVGPTAAQSEEIPPRGNTILKAEMETGEYTANAFGAVATPAQFEVGPERPSGSDELLLP